MRVMAVVLVVTVGLGVTLFKLYRWKQGPNTDDAIVADFARAAAKKAITAREEAEQRIRKLESEVKRLQLSYKQRQGKLVQAERMLKENNRLMREARAREQYIVILEGRLGRPKPHRPIVPPPRWRSPTPVKRSPSRTSCPR
ncbi:MAG: hypothetical protein ACYSU0_16170 [Planctomycetota bacterium]